MIGNIPKWNGRGASSAPAHVMWNHFAMTPNSLPLPARSEKEQCEKDRVIIHAGFTPQNLMEDVGF